MTDGNTMKKLGRRFESIFPEPFDFLDRRGLGLFSPRGGWMYAFPRVDISENNTEVKVVADVPGVDPDTIDIDVDGNWMAIRGRVDRESESDTSEEPHRYERYVGEFRREFALPTSVKEDAIRASYRAGVLTIILPKFEEERRKRIPIEKE